MTRGDGTVYRFGPFELDSAGPHLRRKGKVVPLPPRHAEVLALLVQNAGDVVTNDEFLKVVWHSSVGDDSLARAIWSLRGALGRQKGRLSWIKNIPRLGYKFIEPVAVAQADTSTASLEARRDRRRILIDAKAALESLDRDRLDGARETFAAALVDARDDEAALVGMASARLLLYESKRADLEPDVESLRQAEHDARQAWLRAPTSARAMSTLAFVLDRTGQRLEALVLAREAIGLEPGVWLHHLRLACVSWGDERLLAAQRVIKLCPELAQAHWLAATVYVARQAWDCAFEHARAGCAIQDAQSSDRHRFHAVGFHLLLGLLLLARGLADEAMAEFAREIEACKHDHVYARELRAHAWYAIGAVHLCRERPAEARAAFLQAMGVVPGHAWAGVALAFMTSPAVELPSRAHLDPIDAAMVRAIAFALAGRHADAAGICGDALTKAEPHSAGWLLPVEPLLNVAAHRDSWAKTLALLSSGAH